MNQTEVNDELYRKMKAELYEYRRSLLLETSEVILNNAYEFTVKEDILYYLNENDIGADQAEALLKSDTPLEDCFQEWMNSDSGYMSEIGYAIKNRANEKMAEEREQKAKGDSR